MVLGPPLSAGPRTVVGHQMMPLPRYGVNSTDAQLTEEIRQWGELGIDILAFDQTTQPFNELLLRYLKLSTGLGAPVKFAPQSYGNSAPLGTFFPKWKDAQYAPARLIYDGKPFYAAWHATEIWPKTSAEWSEKQAGETFFRAPHTSAIVNTENDVKALFKDPTWAGAQQLGDWYIAGSWQQQADRVGWWATAAADAGKTARATAIAHYKAYAHKGNWMVYESWGYRRLRDSFAAAIKAGPAVNMVEIVTLNDMSESSYINSWGPDDPAYLVDHWNIGDNSVVLDHSGFRHFAKRYVKWFESGVEPAITEDELYYAYRLHPRSAKSFYFLSAAEKQALLKWRPVGQSQAVMSGVYRKDALPTGTFNGSDSLGTDWQVLSDALHVAVRLTAPADVFINGVNMGTFPAGEHLVSKPGAIAAGTARFGYPAYEFGPSDMGYPKFEIRRAGVSVLAATGELEITPYAVPGCWNMFARKFVKGRVHVALGGLTAGQIVTQGAAATLSGIITGDLSSLARVEFLDGTVKIGEAASIPYSITWKPAALGPHVVTARAISRSGAVIGLSSPIAMGVSVVPWVSAYTQKDGTSYLLTATDVGTTRGGATAYVDATKTFTLDAAGADTNAFRFLWRPITGDTTIVVNLRSVSKAAVWSVAGLMIRESLDPRGLFAAYAYSPNNFNLWYDRRNDGAEANQSVVSGEAAGSVAPQWLKLQRTGDIFTAHHSADGQTWIQDNRSAITMDKTVYAGVFACAQGADVTTKAEFAHLSYVGGSTLPSVALSSNAAATSVPAGQVVALTAAIGSAAGVARVEFHDGGGRLGEDASAPYTWNWSSSATGAHPLRARVVSSTGEYRESAALVLQVVPPVAAPVLTAPTVGSAHDPSASITFSATVASTTNLARIEFLVDGAKIGEATASPFAVTTSAIKPGTHTVIARAVGLVGGSASSAASSFSVRTPAGSFSFPGAGGAASALFSYGDIGAPAIGGSSYYNTNTAKITIVASGANIAETSDSFHFAWRKVDGDTIMTVRLNSLRATHDLAKAGLMFRSSLAPDSRFVSCVQSATQGTLFQRRRADGATAEPTFGPVRPTPVWLRLQRVGDLIRASASDDGVAWTELGSETVPLGTSIYAGLAVTARTQTAATTAVFSQLTHTPSGVASFAAEATVAPSNTRLAGVSARARVDGTATVVIAGFSVTGENQKSVLVRGVGPTLGLFGVENPAAAVDLTLFASSKKLATAGDWWASTDALAIKSATTHLGTFNLLPQDKDAALLANVPAGNYTAVISGRAGNAGIALAEIYDAGDLDSASGVTVRNLSCRAAVGSGEGVTIAGFVVVGEGVSRVLVRAVGPGLRSLGVAGAISDPQVSLFRNSDLIATNHNWLGSEVSAEIASVSDEVGAFELVDTGWDASLIVDLPPGAYTAHVASEDGATGEALVEIYVVR